MSTIQFIYLYYPFRTLYDDTGDDTEEEEEDGGVLCLPFSPLHFLYGEIRNGKRKPIELH